MYLNNFENFTFCTSIPHSDFLYMVTYPTVGILYLATQAEFFVPSNLSYGENFVLGNTGRIFLCILTYPMVKILHLVTQAGCL